MPEIRLAAEDAVELTEMLEFLGDWLAAADPAARSSFARFADDSEDSIEHLRVDLIRFRILLGSAAEDKLIEF
ncbi:hypothetical protein ACIBG0_39570 [Nocardia sp. NPDC050630]|uniref:hypothetical protein n=1 Tax=Nocardia sp. NPDC050630 TaxID=3364321 RepID=UPI003788B804